MDPSIFQKSATGHLVSAEFCWVDQRSGRVDSRTETGWAFVPDPPPPTEVVAGALGKCLPVYARAASALGRLDGFMAQSPGGFNIDPCVLLLPLRLREARLSSQIENTVASAAEVGLAELGKVERSEPIEVWNYMRAIDLAQNDAMPLSETAIRNMHLELLRNIPNAERKLPGRYRDRQVFIGDERKGFSHARFVPPPPGELPRLMAELVRYMREPPPGMEPLLTAAVAHYQFEAIHPFADGNGRLGRMLITLSLSKGGPLSHPVIYPSGYIDRHKQAYYDALLRVSTHGDWAEWIQYFLTAVCTEAEGTIERLQRLMALRTSFLDTMNNRQVGARFVSLIDTLFMHPTFTAALMHKRVGGGKQTIRNHISMLVEQGVVRTVGKSEKHVIYECPAIYAVADED